MGWDRARVRESAAWIAKRFVACGGGVYVLLMVLTCQLQNKILYPMAFGEREVLERPDMSERGGAWMEREVEGVGRVEALFFEAAPSPGEEGKLRPIVLYLHGNGDFVERTAGQVGVWRAMGYHVLVPEYRGYGRSDGEPGAAVIVEDVLWFLDEVARGREDVDFSRLIIHGYSLGGAVAGEVARRRKPWMMVLRSTFSSMASMAHRRWMPGALARDAYDTCEVVASGEFPVLVTHGSEDEVIPVGESSRFEEAAPERVTREVFLCGHASCPPEREYAEVVRAWHVARR